MSYNNRKYFNIKTGENYDKVTHYDIICPVCKQLKASTKPMKLNPPIEENQIINCPICRSRFRIKKTRGSSFNPTDIDIILQLLVPIKGTPLDNILKDAMNYKRNNRRI